MTTWLYSDRDQPREVLVEPRGLEPLTRDVTEKPAKTDVLVRWPGLRPSPTLDVSHQFSLSAVPNLCQMIFCEQALSWVSGTMQATRHTGGVVARDRQAEALSLAEELLADIELRRLGAEQILLKSVRLARLIGDESSLDWLKLELHGYEMTPETRKPLRRMNRLRVDTSGKEIGYLVSLGSIEAAIRAQESRLASLKSPSLSGEFLGIALDRVHNQINGATSSITIYANIRSAALAEIYEFAARTYHELAFSKGQGELFEAARQEIDGLLAPVSDRALERIDSIIERLAQGEGEAISHAMSTCRRLIDSFADAVYPAQGDPITVDGQPVDVGKSKVLNRIDAYVRQRSTSKSRQQRLRQLLRGIYERVSAAVHNDVTPSEARFLFLQTYVALGEILAISETSATDSPGLEVIPGQR
ncbi:hypothetical protein ACFY2Q_03375 [Micromonospora sp. NPDC000316]|uniref:AbiTii domain-containing protein n=1 Tax=Micromonospora sp. NPDC000316 TaxID=3364216 RepID=UPI0036B0B7A8